MQVCYAADNRHSLGMGAMTANAAFLLTSAVKPGVKGLSSRLYCSRTIGSFNLTHTSTPETVIQEFLPNVVLQQAYVVIVK